jgi:phosphatidylinositol 4-kinase
MLHRSGQIIHIDFGFVFGLAPGKQFSMETAPWKLTIEMVELMGGRGSAPYERYLDLCAAALLCARKNAPLVISMMEIMMHHSNYPAFR